MDYDIKMSSLTSDSMLIDIDFHSRSENNSNTWSNVKDDISLLLDILERLSESKIRVVIIGDEVDELNINTFKSDIANTYIKNIAFEFYENDDELLEAFRLKNRRVWHVETVRFQEQLPKYRC